MSKGRRSLVLHDSTFLVRHSKFDICSAWASSGFAGPHSGYGVAGVPACFGSRRTKVQVLLSRLLGAFDFWRGRRSFKPARWDRNPYALLTSQPAQRHDPRHGCCVRAENPSRSEIENGSAQFILGQVVKPADTRPLKRRADKA